MSGAGERLLRSTAREGGRTVAAGFSAAAQLAVVVTPFAVARAVEVALAGRLRVLPAWCLLAAGLGLAGALLRRAEQAASWLHGARAVAALRARIAAGLVASQSGLDRGEVTSRVQRDADEIWEWLSGRVETVGLVVGIAATLLAAGLVDPWLALVAGVALGCALAVTGVFSAAYQRRSFATSAAHGVFAQRLDELVVGAVAVRGVGAEAALARMCHAAGREAATAARDLSRLGAGWRAATSAVPLVAGAAGTAFGAYALAAGRIGVGAVLAFITWMVILAQYCASLVGQYEGRRRALAAADRLVPMLPDPRPHTDLLLSARGALIAADARTAAAGPVSLRAVPGPDAVHDLVAPDPAAAARLLTGDDPCTAGTVTYDGRELAGLDPAVRAAHVRHAPQHPVLLSATIAENVALGRTGDRQSVRRACHLAGLLDEIEAMPDGLETLLGESATGLSGGQRQRLGVARALFGLPAVAILEDAMSAVDQPNAAGLRKRLGTCGTAVVAVTAGERR